MTITCDAIIKMSDEELMRALDTGQPGWEVKYADRVDLERQVKSSDEYADRSLAGLRNRALRNMKDTLWLLGHAGLMVRKEQAAENKE